MALCRLWCILIVSLQVINIFALTTDNAECLKMIPVSFTASQRNAMCSNPTENQRGPGNCATYAKSFHYPIQDTVELCANAPSDSPAQCMKLLSTSNRRTYGLQLCKNQHTLSTMTPGSFPATCFNTLTSAPFKNSMSVQPIEAANFCSHIYDVAPIACALAAAKSTVPFFSGTAVMKACADSMIDEWTSRNTNGSAVATPLQKFYQRPFWLKWLDNFGPRHTLEQLLSMKETAIAICVQDLKSLITTSASSNAAPSLPSAAGLTPIELISFCSHADPVLPENDYFAFLKKTVLAAKAEEEAMAKRVGGKRRHSNTKAATQSSKDVPLDPPKYSSILGECVHSASGVAVSSAPLLSIRQRLLLCHRTLSRRGPVNCARHVLYNGDTHIRSNASLIISLCKQSGRERDISAQAFHTILGDVSQESRDGELLKLLKLGEINDGLATSQCYLESRGLGTVDERVQLCIGALSASIAHCYRRSASVRGLTHSDRLLLCIGAQSEDPAECALAAPIYLTTDEKIALCAGTPNEKHAAPLTCIGHTEAKLKLFKANRHGAGRPASGNSALQRQQQVLGDKITRDLLLNMCSFGGSVEPLASAECLKRAPVELEVDDAIRTCTNTTSADVASRIVLCLKMLPRGWSLLEAASLCNSTQEHVAGPKAIQMIIQCAVQVTQINKYALSNGAVSIIPWSRSDAISICRLEEQSGAVLACLQGINSCASCSPSQNAQYVNAELMSIVCQGAHSALPGKCLSILIPQGLHFATNSAIAQLCQHPHYLSLIACLKESVAHHSITITSANIATCANEPRVVKSAVLTTIETAGTREPFITAGRRFMLVLDLFDRYGIRIHDGDHVGIKVSINENNEQGAVLWGHRSNSSNTGTITLSSLLVTLSGPLTFKVSLTAQPAIVLAFTLTVRVDEKMRHSAICINVFRYGQCTGWGRDAENQYPLIRSTLPFASHYLSALACGPIHGTWYVNSYIESGLAIFEYRAGVDAIWTGIGMPSMDQPFLARLGLQQAVATVPRVRRDGNARVMTTGDAAMEIKMTRSNDASQRNDSPTLPRVALPSGSGGDGGISTQNHKPAYSKQRTVFRRVLKKAYYGKSLQWHPDRWAGMGIYQDVVSTAFELINEAYEGLAREFENSARDGSDGEGEEPEPVYA